MVPPVGLDTRFLSEALPCALNPAPREIRAQLRAVLVHGIDQHKDFPFRRIPCRNNKKRYSRRIDGRS